MYHNKPEGISLRICWLVLGLGLFFQDLALAADPPIVEDQAFSVSENAANGTSLGTVSFSGAESLEITSRDDDEAFALDLATGALTVSDGALLDYEGIQSYTISVRVENEDVTDEAEITIQLLNVDEPGATTAEVDENTITVEGAKLEGTFSDNGGATTAAFQWGTSLPLEDSFGPKAADETFSAEAGDGETPASQTLSGLEDFTTYYYRLVAQNSEGTTFGETKEFTTLSIPYVESITTRDSNPTNSENLSFLVTFSEAVSGVDATDFELEVIPAEAGAELTVNIGTIGTWGEEDGSQYVVNVIIDEADKDKEGTIKLIFRDNDDLVKSLNGVPIGGEGLGNGDFEGGEVYTIDNTAPTVSPLVYTNEDVAVTHSFSVNNDPESPGNVTITASSRNTEIFDLTQAGSYIVTEINSSIQKIKFFPVPHAHGEAIIDITVDDGNGNSSTSQLTIVVRAVADEPLITANDVEGLEDTAIPLDVKVELADQDGSESFTSITLSGVPAGGSLSDFTNSTDNGDGTFTYTFTDKSQLLSLNFIPEANVSGAYEFTLAAAVEEDEMESDLLTKRMASDSKTFKVNVLPVNDEPAFSLSQVEVIRDEDFEDIVEIIISDQSPENESDQEISYSLDPESVDFANVRLDETNRKITIASVPDAHGRQEFTVIAIDELNGRSEKTFILTVNAVNDEPAFSLSQEEVKRDEDFEDIVEIEIRDQSPENESDQEISYSLDPESVDFADVRLDETNRKITIASLPDMYGSQEFTVTATDEGEAIFKQKFTLTVKAVNDAPVFTLHPTEVVKEEDFTTTETVVPTIETPLAFGEEAEEITFSLENADIDFAHVSIDPETGIVTITAVEHGNGQQSIRVVATDNGRPEAAQYEASFLLKVKPVNDDPVLAGELEDMSTPEDELFEFSIPQGIFTDPDGEETLTFTSTLVGGAPLPEWLSFDAESKTFSGTPDGPDVGDYQIKVVAADESLEIEDDFKLSVLPVNDVPLISEIEDIIINLGEEVPEISFTISDEETPADELQLAVVADNAVLLPASAISLSGEGENRRLVLSPGMEAYGASIITITVSDGKAEAEEAFTFTIHYQELALDIPDLITPNGDGANDSWNIRFLSLYEGNEIRVFDRYGRVVFQTRNYQQGPEWNGTQGGNDLPEGVYLYELSVNGGEITKRGTLTIAR